MVPPFLRRAPVPRHRYRARWCGGNLGDDGLEPPASSLEVFYRSEPEQLGSITVFLLYCITMPSQTRSKPVAGRRRPTRTATAVEHAPVEVGVLRQVQSRGLVAIPAAMRGDTGVFRIVSRDDGVIELHPQVTVDKGQAWFWSERWQQREREADEDVAAGRVQRFKNTDDFIDHLKRT